MNNFIKSSFCDRGKCCVDVSILKNEDKVLVRNSKDKYKMIVLSFSIDEWGVFIKGVKNNEFDVN